MLSLVILEQACLYIEYDLSYLCDPLSHEPASVLGDLPDKEDLYLFMEIEAISGNELGVRVR